MITDCGGKVYSTATDSTINPFSGLFRMDGVAIMGRTSEVLVGVFNDEAHHQTAGVTYATYTEPPNSIICRRSTFTLTSNGIEACVM